MNNRTKSGHGKVQAVCEFCKAVTQMNLGAESSYTHCHRCGAALDHEWIRKKPRLGTPFKKARDLSYLEVWPLSAAGG